MYTFLSFNINLLLSFHSSSLRTFTPVYFISFTALVTLSSLALFFLILSRISISSITIFNTCVTLISNYFFFISICSLLTLFTPTFQSGHLLRPSVFLIFLSGTCFKIKLNLDRYKAYLACCLFNFWLFMKYSRFLWSDHISNFLFASSRKCL